MTDTATIPDTQQFTDEMLRCLRVAKSWDVVHRPTTKGTFLARVVAARKALKLLERDLGLLQIPPGAGTEHGSVLLDLKASVRRLRAAVRAMSDAQQVVAGLPRIAVAEQPDEPRAAAVAALYLRAAEG